MSTEQPHSKLIATAASDALKPLGLVRKGRSRTWLDDQGWWLGVVEFQPSSWGRGSYLNTAAHWLWNPKGYISHDYGERVNLGDSDRHVQYVEYGSDEQFTPLANKLAQLAAGKITQYRGLFRDLEATAVVLSRQEGLLAALNAGIALGVCGHDKAARAKFDRYITHHESGNEAQRQTDADEARYQRARELKQLTADRAAFRDRIHQDVLDGRARLKRSAQADLPF